MKLAVNNINNPAHIIFKHSIPHNLQTLTSGGGIGTGQEASQSFYLIQNTIKQTFLFELEFKIQNTNRTTTCRSLQVSHINTFWAGIHCCVYWFDVKSWIKIIFGISNIHIEDKWWLRIIAKKLNKYWWWTTTGRCTTHYIKNFLPTCWILNISKE